MRVTTGMLGYSSMLGNPLINGLGRTKASRLNQLGNAAKKTAGTEKAAKYEEIFKNSKAKLEQKNSGMNTEDDAETNSKYDFRRYGFDSLGFGGYDRYGMNGQYGYNSYLSALLSNRYNYWG